MQKWEYCTLLLGWSGNLINTKFDIYIFYYGSNKNDEQLNSTYSVNKENVIHAVGEALAYLGEQGWELVSYEHPLGGKSLECDAILKRQKK